MVIMFRKPLFRNPVATSSVLPEFRRCFSRLTSSAKLLDEF